MSRPRHPDSYDTEWQRIASRPAGLRQQLLVQQLAAAERFAAETAEVSMAARRALNDALLMEAKADAAVLTLRHLIVRAAQAAELVTT